MDDLFSLKGKVAVVTGASRGLGQAIAVGYAKHGAKLVVSDVLDVGETVKKVEGAGGEAIGMNVDVSNREQVKGMFIAAEERFGGVDILVSNAGILKAGPAESLWDEDWDKVLQVNLKSQFIAAQEVFPFMKKRGGGRIINVASIAGLLAFNQAIPYNASKGGSIQLSRSLALEWAQHNILVNAICPGIFLTGMTNDLLEQEGFKQMIKANVPIGRHAVPEELVGAAIYLASKAGSYTNGHAMVVDGGWTCHL